MLAIFALTAVVVVSRRGDRAPFDAAVRDLAGAPSLQSRVALGAAQMDVRVTARGDTIGTLAFAGLKVGVLTIDGKTYLKAPEGLPADPASGRASPAIAGRWVIGETASLRQ